MDPFEKWGTDTGKMMYRAFVLYSRDPKFAKQIFPEFEAVWEKDKLEWLSRDKPENDQYFKELHELYSRKPI